MTPYDLPAKGSAGAELQRHAHQFWVEAATRAAIDLTGFDPLASLEQRLAWAANAGLVIAAAYSRFSTEMQDSTLDQIRADMEHAAKLRLYIPPEFVCIDEATSGRKAVREGLERLKFILQHKLGSVVVVFKLSRLFRQAHKGFALVQELVEDGVRVTSATQGFDTDDRKSWKLAMMIYGVFDETLIEAIADHVREGLTGKFLAGWTTGAIPVGYKPVEVPGAPRTKRNLARTAPGKDEPAAAMALQHFEWVDQGMDLREGLRRWRAANGPVDPRSTTKVMSYTAYRRMLGRKEYIGIWRYGRKRNEWSSKRDSVRQKPQPEADVKLLRVESLRIVPDDLFFRVQAKLAKLKPGPRQPRSKTQHHLWDLVIGAFHCPHCKGRFHMCGCQGKFMHCPQIDCPAPAMINRREAVIAVCAKLSELLRHDGQLVEQIVDLVNAPSSDGPDELARQIEAVERKIRSATHRITDLEELLGSGSDEDRKRRKAQIITAAGELAGQQAELSRLKKSQSVMSATPVTREEILAVLADLAGLLDDAAAGKLGTEVAHKAADLFTRLVGGVIEVHAQRRPERKRWVIKGTFVPGLLIVAAEKFATTCPDTSAISPVEIWLRSPPRVDLIADEVVELYDVQKLGFRVIAQKLQQKYGVFIGSGNICLAYKRWYESRGLPLPPRRTTMGRPRKSA